MSLINLLLTKKDFPTSIFSTFSHVFPCFSFQRSQVLVIRTKQPETSSLSVIFPNDFLLRKNGKVITCIPKNVLSVLQFSEIFFVLLIFFENYLHHFHFYRSVNSKKKKKLFAGPLTK